LARAIVEYREAHGPFQALEDLLLVPGIGPSRLAQIRDLVRVD
jgi:competence protein ComEA